MRRSLAAITLIAALSLSILWVGSAAAKAATFVIPGQCPGPAEATVTSAPFTFTAVPFGSNVIEICVKINSASDTDGYTLFTCSNAALCLPQQLSDGCYSTVGLGTPTASVSQTGTQSTCLPIFSAAFFIGAAVGDTDLALQVPGNLSVDATSLTGAKVTFTASMIDEGEVSSASCSPASGSIFPIGTTTVTCTAFDQDDTPSSVSGSFTITVRGALPQLQDLLVYTQSLGVGTSLSDKVSNTIAYVQAGDILDACFSGLQSLINQANALAGKQISTAQANAVITAALRIFSVLGCFQHQTGGS
jgi:hypothetical protein